MEEKDKVLNKSYEQFKKSNTELFDAADREMKDLYSVVNDSYNEKNYVIGEMASNRNIENMPLYELSNAAYMALYEDGNQSSTNNVATCAILNDKVDEVFKKCESIEKIRDTISSEALNYVSSNFYNKGVEELSKEEKRTASRIADAFKDKLDDASDPDYKYWYLNDYGKPSPEQQEKVKRAAKELERLGLDKLDVHGWQRFVNKINDLDDISDRPLSSFTSEELKKLLR